MCWLKEWVSVDQTSQSGLVIKLLLILCLEVHLICCGSLIITRWHNSRNSAISIWGCLIVDCPVLWSSHRRNNIWAFLISFIKAIEESMSIALIWVVQKFVLGALRLVLPSHSRKTVGSPFGKVLWLGPFLIFVWQPNIFRDLILKLIMIH